MNPCCDTEPDRLHGGTGRRPLLVFGITVVSPDAVIERGGEAQPGQVRRHEQGGGAVDGIPRHHGGSNSTSQTDDLDQCLNLKKRETFKSENVPSDQRQIYLRSECTHFNLCAPKKIGVQVQFRASCSP